MTGCGKKTIQIWDVTKKENSLRVFRGHRNAIWSIAISLDGKHVVTGSHDCTVKIWSFGNGKERRTLRGHED